MEIWIFIRRWFYKFDKVSSIILLLVKINFKTLILPGHVINIIKERNNDFFCQGKQTKSEPRDKEFYIFDSVIT